MDDPIPYNSSVAALISVVLPNSPPAPLFRKERGANDVAGFEDYPKNKKSTPS